MKLPNSLRDQFKTPLGVLLPIGEDNKENIQKHLSKTLPKISAAVWAKHT